MLLLLLDTGVCYLLLLLSPPKLVHLTVFWWALIFMSVSHIYRMYTDYNGYVSQGYAALVYYLLFTEQSFD